MKTHLTAATLFLGALLLSQVAVGGEGDGQGQRRGKAQGRNAQGRNAQDMRGRGADGAARMGRGGDPARMVQAMMQRFDTDGDQKLDAKELTALLTSMRERGGRGMAQGGNGGPGGRPEMADKGRRRGQRGDEGQREPGGQRPKRPASE